ncbi:MAG: serine/threonine protein kinase [Myxococcales bacterium]|nr:serine/threonine protein kinase [Myxococcales bacterium]
MSRALGRYELLRPLARGGMAEVFLARRRAAGVEKWLVVKRMRPERVGDVRFLDLFVREARLSMSLAHQNIVPVFDFGRIDDQVFLAMERVEGKDLGTSLSRAARTHALPPMLAAFIAAECCQALDYAHQRRSPEGAPLGIVHRDVTPRNVLLSWSGEVKLTDFGIAALAGDEPMKTIGTPAYMAPEQARGEALDARADLYAVGMVLREALTGERPRRGDDREATLAAARAGELAPWPDGFDSPLKTIIDRATAVDREARYADARTMLEDIDTFIVGERAARKSDAPARQLASWLAIVWKEAREESAIDEAIEASHLVSFMDDGEMDVIGTGTVRSMLATAADAPLTVVNPEPPPSLVAPAPKAVEPPPADPKSAPRASSWMAQAALTVVLIGGGAIAWIKLSTRAEPVATATNDKASDTPIDKPVIDKAPDKPVIDKPADTPIEHAPAPVEQVRPVRVATNLTPRKPKLDVKAVIKPPPGPPLVTRKATINSQPWSYWTIDDDPTRHQGLEQVQLTPGPHRIHFTGNEHFAVDKTMNIEVSPDHDFARAWKLAE